MKSSHLPIATVVCWFGTFAIGVCLPDSLVAEDVPAKPTLTRQNPWRSVFGDQKVKLRWATNSDRVDRFYWSLASSDKLVIEHGEVLVDQAAKPAHEIESEVTIPPVKPGVVLPCLLTAQIFSANARKPEAEITEPLWIFPEDPFYDRSKWLKEQQLVLYDPAGQTAQRMKDAKIPFEQIDNVQALSEVTSHLVVIGEGISFADDRALPELMITLVGRGIPVLCLSPTQGEFPMTLAGVSPAAMLFHRGDRIRQLDKRLDDAFWMSVAVVPGHSLRLAGQGEQVIGEVIEGSEGWPWVEWQFAQPNEAASEDRTKLLLTCLPLIEHWEDGPTPRFLFARMLEYVSKPIPPSK